MIVPVGVGVILSGGLFYVDGEPASTLLRVSYAALYKPVFQLLIVGIIIGCIFKIENVYRGIVEWRGFTWTGKVAYGGFLLHTLFQRGLIGSQVAPIHVTDYYVLTIMAATILLSFMSAGILWVCVENPCASVTKALFMPPKRDTSNNNKTADSTKV
ncbi:hypothetical protein O0L34_g8035 [Tuta absoluta]|nr:hypothetical protein O0L34_g8035 [Tuta absoluta]